MKHSYRKTDYYSATVSSGVSTLAIDCRMMDTAAFVMSFGSGLTCNVAIEESIDGVTFIDSGIIIEPLSGTAATRWASFPINLTFVRVTLSGVSGSGTVSISAQAKGFS